MAVFLAWSDHAVDLATPGPWESMHRATHDLVFIESSDTLSRVYHELKWSLPDGAALLVVPVTARPKLARVAAGTLGWARARLP